jgi:diguanylate cyclase (GGDEF)-like protein
VADADTQQATLLYLSSTGEPQLRFESQTRRAFQQGQEATRLFLGMTLLITLAALLLAYLALEIWIIRRVRRLNQEVAGIGSASRLSRLSDLGADEIASWPVSQSDAHPPGAERSTRPGDTGEHPRRLFRAGRRRHRAAGEQRLLPHARLQQRRDAGPVLPATARPAGRRSRPRPLRAGGALANRKAPSPRPSAAATASASMSKPGSRRCSMPTGGRGLRGILRDISLQAAYQNRLLEMAYRDALTGLGNRKAFNEELPLAPCNAPRAGGHGPALHRPDHFKPVNDRFGHAVGDALLKQVGERLRNNLRQPDMAFRLGGDEFAVILDDADGQLAERLAKRLLHSLNAGLPGGRTDLDFLSASIGIAVYPQDASDADGLIQAADSAMYQAKANATATSAIAPGNSPASGQTDGSRRHGRLC